MDRKRYTMRTKNIRRLEWLYKYQGKKNDFKAKYYQR